MSTEIKYYKNKGQDNYSKYKNDIKKLKDLSKL